MSLMKIRCIAATVSLMLFGAFAASAALEQREWKIDGVAREAMVWMPESTNNAPLVFAFHGHGGNMKNAARSFRMHELWPEAVVVYMQGLPTPGQLTDPEGKKNGWNSKPADPGNRDLKFFDEVYTSLRDRIDTNRVYSTGHSNGGGFTYCLWAARGDRFAAVAPSAALSREAAPLLKPKPAMHIAGTGDTLVKYEWQAMMIEQVKKLNGCSEKGEPWASDGDLAGTLYPSKGGTPLVTLIHPGTHAYPRGAPPLIVRFFKEHARKP
jgi:polyhydroxybutyrate depolymerase